jgi:hypothetical protein
MAIIVVGGSAKGVGKTTLVCGLIAALDSLRWIAVKITGDAHPGLPPIYEETTAGEEKSVGPSTDTARYLAAGAERAFLLTVPPERDLAQALDEFWLRIGRGANLIFESNRVASHVNADVCLMVRGGPREQIEKSSFRSVVRYADAMVVRGGEDRMFEDAMNIGGQKPRPIFNLKHFDIISPDLRGWLEKRQGLTA